MKRPSPAVINILLVAVIVLAVLLGIFLVSSKAAMTAASSALAFLFGEEAANAVGMVSRLIVVGTFVVGAVWRFVGGSKALMAKVAAKSTTQTHHRMLATSQPSRRYKKMLRK